MNDAVRPQKMRFPALAGFTLIEVMIAVAIIGLLVTVAVPAYRTFQGRARSAAAKTSLSAVYAVEKTFYQEHLSFTSCLAKIGYKMDADYQWYAIGFGARYNDNTCGPTGTTACNSLSWNPSDGASLSTCAITESNVAANRGISNGHTQCPLPDPNLVPSLGLTIRSFNVAAAGCITSDQKLDAWTLDEEKRLNHVTVGY